TIVPEATFESAPPLDVLVVPGGPGQIDQMENEKFLGFLRRAGEKARIVSSVCTGALLLAKAGFLDGKRATTHWLARDALAKLGAKPVRDRVVRDVNVVTGAGVSAGIDFALRLVAELEGENVAQAIQLAIEYDPQPPFDVGSPEKAPPALVAALRKRARHFL
ncbi:MAG: DJ-1/PfpI family protein, partial [Vicinamibacteria bacterium]